jgi:CAAX protease family protein
VGLVGYPLVVAALWAWTPLGVLDAFVLAALVQLIPFLAVAQFRRLPEGEVPRVSVYLSSAAMIAVVGGVSLAAGLARGGGWALGFGPVPWRSVLVWAVAISAIALASAPLGVRIRHRFGIVETDFLKQLLPRSRMEKGVFALLSLIAGVGEEIAYRGYAISSLALATGSVPMAVIVSSAAFGMLHTYQGWIGIVRTGLLGAILAGVFLISGSIWPPIAVHVSLDLWAGLVIGDRYLN